MKRKKVKSIKQLGNTGTQLEKEVAAMEEAMKQHNIEENCQKLIDGLMPQIKDMERTLYGTYHRNIIEYSTSRIKTPESIVEKLHRKNYITKPKSSGYRSIHLILRPTKTTSNIKCIEVQVRSAAMNYWAILEHQLCYKNEKKGAERIRKELKECAIDIAKIDKKMLKLRKEIEKI